MGLSRRLIGVSAIFTGNEVTDVDVDGLLSRLLLFDKYVLNTIRLKEFPILVRYLGYEGLRDLLKANLIEVRCECFQATQLGQSGMFGDPILPPLSYKFNYLDASDRHTYVHDCLQNLHGATGLTKKQVIKLKGLVAGSIRPLSLESRREMFPAFKSELSSSSILKQSVQMVLEKQALLKGIPFSLSVHAEGEDTFRIETDLARHSNISDQEAHRIVEAGLMGIHGFSQTMVEMKAYHALSGFRHEELPLLRHKLDFLAETVTSHTKEKSFHRVMEVAGLPKFLEQGRAVNIERLLKIRHSSEAREFRDWLEGVAEASDEEIRNRVASLRTQAGLKVGGETGKTVRFLVTTGVGFIPGATAAGIAVGAIDQFAMDKLLPRSGIAAFVNELYPSIFERKPV